MNSLRDFLWLWGLSKQQSLTLSFILTFIDITSCVHIHGHHVEVRHQHWEVRSSLPPCEAVSLIVPHSRLFDLWTLGQLSLPPLPKQESWDYR